jgi:hypothetical protein
MAGDFPRCTRGRTLLLVRILIEGHAFKENICVS